MNKAGSESVFIHKLFNIEIGTGENGDLGTSRSEIGLTKADSFGKRLRNPQSKTINYPSLYELEYRSPVARSY